MTEEQLQAACFQWIYNSYPILRGLCWHVPNEGKRSPITGNKLKAQGLLPGAPDLCFHYKGKAYFFELKVAKNKLSNQQRFIKCQLRDHGFEYYEIRVLEQFQTIIKEILST